MIALTEIAELTEERRIYVNSVLRKVQLGQGCLEVRNLLWEKPNEAVVALQ